MPNPAEGYESYMVPTLFGPCATNLIEASDPSRVSAFWIWAVERGLLLDRLLRAWEPGATSQELMSVRTCWLLPRWLRTGKG